MSLLVQQLQIIKQLIVMEVNKKELKEQEIPVFITPALNQRMGLGVNT